MDLKGASLEQEIELPPEDTIYGQVSQQSHNAMEVGINISSNYYSTLRCGDQMLALGMKDVSGCNSVFDGNGHWLEVSAIYLYMKYSKLECVDEHGQDSMSSERNRCL